MDEFCNIFLVFQNYLTALYKGLAIVQLTSVPGHAKPTVPQNIRGTSTLSDYNPAHTLIFTIILYKSCAATTFIHLEPLLLKNYICIVAFAPNAQRALI